jgi:hypothetical protein
MASIVSMPSRATPPGRCQGEGEEVDEDVARAHPPLPGQRVDEPLGDPHLPVGGAGLALLVDGQRDDGAPCS